MFKVEGLSGFFQI